MHLLDEGTGQKSHKRHRCPSNCCNPAAEQIGEHTDDRRAEEDHAHRERADPCCIHTEREASSLSKMKLPLEIFKCVYMCVITNSSL